VSDDDLIRAPDVQAAFDAIRRSPTIDLAPADDLRFVPQAVIRGREIVIEDAIALPTSRTTLRYLAGVDLVALVRIASAHRHVPDLYDAFCRAHAPVSMPALLAALSLLIANRILIARQPTIVST
jgi:hypothetical protein